jgi:murein DD-endopeptidase MepM/ murein hydrolase activator NlpD
VKGFLITCGVGSVTALLLATQSYVDDRREERESTLVGALAFVEAAIETSQGIDVEFFKPSIDPTSSPGVWSLTGLVVTETPVNRTHGTTFTAVLERLCESAAAECWRLKEFRLAGVVASLSGPITNQDEAASRQEDLDRLASSLKRQLAEKRETQLEMMDSYSEFAMTRAENLADVMTQAGLDADLLVSRHFGSDLASGGPLISARAATAGPDPAAGSLRAVLGANRHWDRLFALEALYRRLPISAPLKNYRISSYYGVRVDPITGKQAYHTGIDLVAPPGAIVRATAPGTVTFAGDRGRYGNLVEIDHGYGLFTRYGHLSDIYVEAGQPVAHDQVIAVMGSSGRSTGPHLHYEIRSRNRTLDPLKFLQAGAAAVRLDPALSGAEPDVWAVSLPADVLSLAE